MSNIVVGEGSVYVCCLDSNIFLKHFSCTVSSLFCIDVLNAMVSIPYISLDLMMALNACSLRAIVV